MSLDKRMLCSRMERTSVAGDGELSSWVIRVSLAITDLEKLRQYLEASGEESSRNTRKVSVAVDSERQSWESRVSTPMTYLGNV